MKPDEVRDAIQQAFPKAEVILEALVNDGNHYKVTVIAEVFRDLSRIRQHQMVYQALGNKMGNELHALSVVTKSPNNKD